MYAIIEIAGHQYKVEKDRYIYTNRLAIAEGESTTFEQVLLLDDNGSIAVGAPTVSGAQVKAKVVQHLRGDKVIVFKKKRRKSYQKQNGHRQYLTKLLIEDITK